MTAVPGPTPPALVTLHVWVVPAAAVPAAASLVAASHLGLRRVPGLTFAKVLGTGDGRTFRLRDATPRRWALLVAWSQRSAATAFSRSRLVRSWDAVSEERLVVGMRPLRSRGRWSGRQPFGPDATAAAAPAAAAAAPAATTGPVAAVTRARLDRRHRRAFRQAVPAVAADLSRAPGLRMAMAIGERPVGLQGTFSVWDDADALAAFAYRGSPHREVVARTPTAGWYTEELFARLAVVSADGTVDGRPLCA